MGQSSSTTVRPTGSGFIVRFTVAVQGFVQKRSLSKSSKKQKPSGQSAGTPGRHHAHTVGPWPASISSASAHFQLLLILAQSASVLQRRPSSEPQKKFGGQSWSVAHSLVQ